jgi:hypothetical protein
VTGTPSLATVATTGDYADLSNTPSLATVATTGAYSDLSGAPTLGTASAEDVGTSAGNVVQLNGSAQLPAVDGSLLTNITADVSSASVGDLSDVTITSATTNQVLKYNGTAWVNTSVAASEVTGLATVATTGAASDLTGLATVATTGAASDLTGLATVATTGAASDLTGLANVATSGSYADLSNTPTLGTAAALDVGTSANNVVQLNGSAQLPAVDGSNLTGITADVSTASIGDLSDVSLVSAADGDALVYDGTNWRDLALATVATTGDYDDLVNAPSSMIGTAEFITNADALNLVAGKHYIIGTANATTKTMTLPDVSSVGEYIRVTNWGDGELVIQVDQVSSDAYLLVGNTIVQNGQVTIESRATVDLFGFDYVAGGYEPAWGVYFSSSIETNTRSFNTTGQLPVYDATNKEFSAGDAGDLTLSYSPTNYTSAGNGIADHLGGIDTELGLKADRKTYESKNTSFTASIAHHYSINTSSTSVTVTLPPVSLSSAGSEITLKLKDATNGATLTPNGSDTIDGLSSYSMSNLKESVTLISDGSTDWEIV